MNAPELKETAFSFHGGEGSAYEAACGFVMNEAKEAFAHGRDGDAETLRRLSEHFRVMGAKARLEQQKFKEPRP